MQGRTAGTWSPVAKALPMSKPIIRYLRFHCPTPTSMPQANRDGALAVAAIREDAQLAQMLLVDMRRWDRNDGASLRDALGVLVPAAHRRLVAGFGIPMADTLIVEWDGGDVFFRLRVEGEAAQRGCDDAPACARGAANIRAGGLPSLPGRDRRVRRCSRRSKPWWAVCGRGWKGEAPIPPRGAPRQGSGPPEGGGARQWWATTVAVPETMPPCR
jgi:hypothetical protein